VGRGAAIATAVVLTWLNPHVYLDTVLFLGSLANQYDGARWWWAAGAVTASFLWFFSLGFGARLLRPVFSRPVAKSTKMGGKHEGFCKTCRRVVSRCVVWRGPGSGRH
jgi:arginine exporter protein ArgO